MNSKKMGRRKFLKGASAAKSNIGIVAMKTQAGGLKSQELGGLNPHQAALKFVLSDNNIATAVPGVTTVEQLEEAAAVMGKLLTQKDLKDLKQYQEHIQGRFCTMCGGCSGECPNGNSSWMGDERFTRDVYRRNTL